jgi:hypothetical protein
MATFNYGPLSKVGMDLIKKFGRPVPCTVQRSVDGTPADATKPWRPSAATQLVFKFTGVVVPYVVKRATDTDQEDVIYAPGDIVSVGADSAPSTLCGYIQPSDNIESLGVVYSIIGMHNLNPGGAAAPIFFKMRCKAWPSDTMTPVTQF